MNDFEEALNRVAEMDPELEGRLKAAIDEKTKDGPVTVLVVGNHNAQLLTAVLARIGAERQVAVQVEPEPMRIDRTLIAEKIGDLSKLVRELQYIEDCQSPHDLDTADAQEIERVKPVKTKVKGFQSNRQFKQQKPAFKNQHQMRAMIRPPRRGG